MNDEVKLILKKLEIVSSTEEPGAYICDKEHSKILLNYIKELEDNLYASNQAVNELLDIKELCTAYEEEHKGVFKIWWEGQKVLSELEDWVRDNLGNCRTNQKYTLDNSYAIKEDIYIRCLNKIQELKEKYKNE